MAFQIVNDSTLSAIVQNVAALVSYPTPSDPAGSIDPSVQQMVQAVNLAGIDLLSMNDWQELQKVHTMSIEAESAGQSERAFDLPEDSTNSLIRRSGIAPSSGPPLGLSRRSFGSSC